MLASTAVRTFRSLRQPNARGLLASTHLLSRPLPLFQPRINSCYFFSAPRRSFQYSRFPDQRQQNSSWLPRDPAARIAIYISIGGVLYYVAHLEQVPETGRWRFMDISPRLDSKLAQASYAELLTQFRGKILPADHPITRHVRRVVTDILETNNLGSLYSSEPRRRSFFGDDVWEEDAFAAARPRIANPVPESGGKEWHLLVVNDPKVVNAMATFGNIVVFTGILPICKDEQGLAAVLGHEIGHVVARHPQERYSSTKILIFVALLLQAVGLDWGFSNLVSKLLLDLPNSRKQELEADTVGLRLIARACYDPRSAVEMHLRLANHERMHGGSSLEFLRTHPGATRRIKHLEEQIPEADAIRVSNPRCTTEQQSIDQFNRMSRWADRAVQEAPFQL